MSSGVELVLCDISPLGLEIARLAGLPSVLLENFTWDWIYEPLVALEARFGDWVPFLRERFALADLHLQLEPVCAPVAGAVAVPPVSRAARQSAAEVRERLAVPEGHAFVLVSLGGVAHRLEGLAPLASCGGATFVLPGASEREETIGNLRLLPHHSPIHHPDLVAAADLVVGKLGYSTVAECVAAGARMLYVPRPDFRESAVLERYVGDRLPVAAARRGARIGYLGESVAGGPLASAPRGRAYRGRRAPLGRCDRRGGDRQLPRSSLNQLAALRSST